MTATVSTPDIDLTETSVSSAGDELHDEKQQRKTIDWIWGVMRIALGWIFLWPFLDKTFGLGFATAGEDAWIDGGSPTFGFLTFGTKGPFADFFQSLAGNAWADWLFMLGLLAIGVALMAGVAVRLAAASGVVMLMLMWAAALAPEHNPLIDDHVIYAIALTGVAVVHAGDHLGLGRWWNGLDIVRRIPILR